jgi:DNA-directed RNA polymerase I subunit RPA49
MSHRAKRLKAMPLPSQIAKAEQAEYRARRNDLGEAFGTRKAKSQIRAAERGKVNATAMEGVREHLMDSVEVAEEDDGTFPDSSNRFEVEMVSEERWWLIELGIEKPSDFIPVPNMTAYEVDQVYPRESIIPSDQWSAIDVAPIVKAKDEFARTALMPSRHSAWITRKVGEVIRGPSATRKTNL